MNNIRLMWLKLSEGDWAYGLIKRFVISGGFESDSAITQAYEDFLTLESVGVGDCEDQLALWSLICIEADQAPPVKLISEIRRIRGRHSKWVGMLAFTLANYLYECRQLEPTDGYDEVIPLHAFEATEVNLFHSILNAYGSFDKESFRKVSLHLNCHQVLLWKENAPLGDLPLGVLERCIILLEHLESLDSSGAAYILGHNCILDYDFFKSSAAEGFVPASFYLCLQFEDDPFEGNKYALKVTFDAVDEYIDDLANYCTNDALCFSTVTSDDKLSLAFLVEEIGKIETTYKELPTIQDQYDQVRRCQEQLRHNDYPEFANSLAIEVGKLVECFFKTCFCKNAITKDKFDKYNRHIRNDKGTYRLLNKCRDKRANLIKKVNNAYGLNGMDLYKSQVWNAVRLLIKLEMDYKGSFLGLVLGNVLSSDADPNHSFKKLPDSRLLKLEWICSKMRMRNNAAHFPSHRITPQRAMVFSEEVLFWLEQIMRALGEPLAK